MGLLQQIQQDYKQALKAREKDAKEILSFLIGQIKNKRIELGRDVSDDEIMKIIKKEIKSRKETIGFLEKAMKLHDIETENEKIAILETYLPDLLSAEELKTLIQEYIIKLDIQDPQKQRGQLIGAIMKDYGAQVDGALLNTLISGFFQ